MDAARLSLTVHEVGNEPKCCCGSYLPDPFRGLSRRFNSRCSHALPSKRGRGSNPLAVVVPEYRTRYSRATGASLLVAPTVMGLCHGSSIVPYGFECLNPSRTGFLSSLLTPSGRSLREEAPPYRVLKTSYRCSTTPHVGTRKQFFGRRSTDLIHLPRLSGKHPPWIRSVSALVALTDRRLGNNGQMIDAWSTTWSSSTDCPHSSSTSGATVAGRVGIVSWIFPAMPGWPHPVSRLVHAWFGGS